MADVLKILLIILGILTIYVSYWLLAEALFPKLVERASHQYRRPVTISLMGLGVAVVPIVLGLLFSKMPNPLAKVTGLTLIAVPILLGLVGSAGFTLRIGAGLPSPTDAAQPWRRVLRGGIVLACAFLLPIVGWFVLPIWVLVSGLGALVCCLRERCETSKPSPANFVPTPEAAA
jgi:hypothetical protein